MSDHPLDAVRVHDFLENGELGGKEGDALLGGEEIACDLVLVALADGKVHLLVELSDGDLDLALADCGGYKNWVTKKIEKGGGRGVLERKEGGVEDGVGRRGGHSFSCDLFSFESLRFPYKNAGRQACM